MVIELNYKEFQNKLISILNSFRFRREEGIRTLDTLWLYTLSRRAPSTTRPPLFTVPPVLNFRDGQITKKISIGKILTGILLHLPAQGVSKTVLNNFGAIALPNRYISFATAASVVISLPLMICSFLSCSLVSYCPI